MPYYVYILASKPNGTLYIGVSSNLERRVQEHKLKAQPGFTQRYNVKMLVYYEETQNVQSAILREKQLKGWKRCRKIALIQERNPHWQDMAEGLEPEDEKGKRHGSFGKDPQDDSVDANGSSE